MELSEPLGSELMLELFGLQRQEEILVVNLCSH